MHVGVLFIAIECDDVSSIAVKCRNVSVSTIEWGDVLSIAV